MPVSDAVAAKRIFGKRALHQGMRGRDVRVLQDFLTRAGFNTTIDGQYGSGTARRVRAWEASAERKVNGRVSRPDAKALRITVESCSAEREPAERRAAHRQGHRRPRRPRRRPRRRAPAGPGDHRGGQPIATKPYKYGGGHGKWEDTGYDCSGSMSYAFHGAGMLDEALDSTGFMSWGEAGKGTWVTIYAKGSHAYMIVAGLRFDTSGRADQGTRWQEDMRSSSGYTVRHPEGL